MNEPGSMRAMVLHAPGQVLSAEQVPVPVPSAGQIRVRVDACAVCRTDLHVVDGELSQPRLPLIPGHEVIGQVVDAGAGADRFQPGERIGVPWLGYTCGACRYCRAGQENLCEAAGFTGYTLDGGYAEYMVADERFCFPVPDRYQSVEAAPLLCAGLIGFRSYRMAGAHVEHLGLYGFGAAAHILAQVAAYQGRRIYAFTRPGDTEGQGFARRLGAAWVGGSDQRPPVELDAAVIFAPVGALVPAALAAVRPGGVVVCGGIHMSDIPSFPYSLLWQERVLCSVANLTRADGEAFMALAEEAPIRTETRVFALEQANEALEALRAGRLEGAAVLAP
jgi:propanol-preferring alcohol dehydrogenase